MTDQLTLYISSTCPFCFKVLDVINHYNIDIPTKNIYEDDAAYTKLVTIGGKSQVPCLFINDKALYESDDIITYINEHCL